ncbi:MULTISPECIES: GGDEF domain-containing protein [Sphingomonas]|uniref:GGDEF domain-containing protein n=1 Tax=Sphingomonas TaxID=13687 RepID=UPI000DEF214C|nr:MULTISPECIES: GGDEF domain-containing protein [Sphingomonas]
MIEADPIEHRVSDSTYLELIDSLLANLVPTSIMSFLFVLVASAATNPHSDHYLTGFALAGAVASVARILVLALQRIRLKSRPWTLESAAKFEKLFGSTYIAFAALLGLFAARAMLICDLAMQVLLAALVVGYAAGVAAGVSLRPRISLLALLVAVIPFASASAMIADPSHLTLSLILVALLIGGIGSIRARYRWTTDNIGMRDLLSSLARHDPLTGLANRLGLAEAYSRVETASDSRTFAMHYLDLDRFKPVNDQYGHLVGDRLLQLVARRLSDIAGGSGIACRLGGDEFALLQTAITHPGEVELVRRRITRTLERPYEIDGVSIVIGVSIGSVLGDGGSCRLEELLERADAGSYAVKRGRQTFAAAGPAMQAAL